jgi:ribosomal protein S18 acetylase RimI-like enzyme
MLDLDDSVVASDRLMIELLGDTVSDHDLDGLTALLVDAVDGGASVSFLPPMDRARAQAWWRDTLADRHPRAAVLIARDAEGIVGTVQLQPTWAPNGPHRAEVVKMLVHRRGRRRGIGRALMRAVEAHAAAAGFTLLFLDTKQGDAGEALYRSCGWTEVGSIPDYAVDADGSLVATVIFYRRLA